MKNNTTFALLFGNRGFFPETLIAEARREMELVLREQGYDVLMMDAAATPHGAVEGTRDGACYAEFLRKHRGMYDGVVLCLPNFGDEAGAIAALRDCGTPILIQAYPDDLDKMGFSCRRDAFCGKFSIMDVFYQNRLPFTAFKPHVVRPSSRTFVEHLHVFAAVCRIVRGMRRMTVGAIGARTTAFKTVRFDEITLEKHGITTEAFDLSEVLRRASKVSASEASYRDKAERLGRYADWSRVPQHAFDTLTKLAVVIDDLVAEHELDAIALRCWLELEQELGVSPCVLLSELNDRGLPAACELDVCNAVAMRALSLASESPAACLDWNNNYGDDEEKCILFHCGPVPAGLMAGKGRIVEHPMFEKVLGPGRAFGCNVGRLAPGPMTFASAKTDDGSLCFYVGEGRITEDKIPDDFFGCAGVAEIKGLQEKLQKIGYGGYRHHVSVTAGHIADALQEAMVRYLGYELMQL